MAYDAIAPPFVLYTIVPTILVNLVTRWDDRLSLLGLHSWTREIQLQAPSTTASKFWHCVKCWC